MIFLFRLNQRNKRVLVTIDWLRKTETVCNLDVQSFQDIPEGLLDPDTSLEFRLC